MVPNRHQVIPWNNLLLHMTLLYHNELNSYRGSETFAVENIWMALRFHKIRVDCIGTEHLISKKVFENF